jgi:hypothetical protein
MTTNPADNARIATLTSDAIRASGDKVAKDIMANVDAVEETARLLRSDAEHLIEQIQRHTNEFADRVNLFVVNCHDAVEMLKEHKAKIFDDAEVPVDNRPAVPLMLTAEHLAEPAKVRTNGNGHGK